MSKAANFLLDLKERDTNGLKETNRVERGTKGCKRRPKGAKWVQEGQKGVKKEPTRFKLGQKRPKQA